MFMIEDKGRQIPADQAPKHLLIQALNHAIEVNKDLYNKLISEREKTEILEKKIAGLQKPAEEAAGK